MKLLTYNWVRNYLKDNEIEEARLRTSFGQAATYRGLLEGYIKKELASLDKKCRLDTLSEKPNRAELLLAYQAQREVLYNFLDYIIDKP